MTQYRLLLKAVVFKDTLQGLLAKISFYEL